MTERYLMFMPTYEKDGIVQVFPDAYDSFMQLEVPEGVTVDRVIGLDNPYGLEGKHRNTLHQYQQIQKRVIAEEYDGLITFEHDMLVPKDGIKKLLEVPAEKAQVVYGLYMLRHGAYCVNAFLHIEGSPNPHKSMTYLPRAFKQAEQRGWAQVSGVGMGFTLFRRKVLKRFAFRASGDSYPPDWAISVDCTKHGFRQICRFDLKCGHIDSNCLVVYPTATQGEVHMAKVKIMKQFVSGELYLPGQVVDIPLEKLDDFIRAGYVQVMSEPDIPAVKIMRKPDKKTSKAVKDGNN